MLQKDSWILVRSGEALLREISSGLSWRQAELLCRDWAMVGCNNPLPVLTEAKEMYKNGKGFNLTKNCMHFASFAPITLNQLAFGSLNANQ